MARLFLAKFAILSVTLVLMMQTIHHLNNRVELFLTQEEISENMATQKLEHDALGKVDNPIHLQKAPNDPRNGLIVPPFHYQNGADFNMSQLVDSNGKVKGVFVTLARNRELKDLIQAIRSVEDRFNRKYHYDWVFFNDEEFTTEFVNLTSAIVSGKTRYGKIPKEHWLYPDWVDQKKAAQLREKLKTQGVAYGDLESYRHMCRFELGFFWQNDLLAEYEWYWRVEPGIKIHCDLNYDLFRYMQDNRKVYGMVITIHEFPATIPTLWKETKAYIEKTPSVVAENNAMRFLSDDDGKTYNMCHFWSNFEIASLNFWRSKAFRDYFETLDATGGFFYERWGDAPIHSIAASLFLLKDKVHFFSDMGYTHGVYTQCPLDEDFRYRNKCTCDVNLDFTFRGYSCGKLFHDTFQVKKPKNWEQYT